MEIVKLKLNPNVSVMEQAKRYDNRKPVLIHQHFGSVTRPIPGLTTNVVPRPGNYAKLTCRT